MAAAHVVIKACLGGKQPGETTVGFDEVLWDVVTRRRARAPVLLVVVRSRLCDDLVDLVSDSVAAVGAGRGIGFDPSRGQGDETDPDKTDLGREPQHLVEADGEIVLVVRGERAMVA
ncbi:MAG: hypothetical protein M3456_07530 [Actinomycetota bacterium]|nr:hypothetical protein [Actinomycetota bacterium]